MTLNLSEFSPFGLQDLSLIIAEQGLVPLVNSKGERVGYREAQDLTELSDAAFQVRQAMVEKGVTPILPNPQLQELVMFRLTGFPFYI